MAKSKANKPGRARTKQPVGTSKRRTGRQYRTTQVMLRVTSEEKQMMTRSAERDGDSLSTWLRRLAIRRVKQLKLTVR